MASAIEIVRSFRQMRALVIGDAMLDTYLEGTAARLCSEGPVPVVRKTLELHLPGGAANTAVNLRALEAGVRLLSFAGRDSAGTLLRSALRERGVDDGGLIEDKHASTLHKLRILADGQYVVRFDDEETHSYTRSSQQRLLTTLDAAFAWCDVIIVSDYCYGVVSDALLARLRELRERHPKPLLVDSKQLRRFRNARATMITPNVLEARLLVGQNEGEGGSPGEKETTTPFPAVEQLGRRLLALLDTEYVALTMASDGVMLVSRQGNVSHIPAHPVQRAHDIGAGDSFAAALALALAAGADAREAARIGIDAAGIAVTRPWTSMVSAQELLQRVSLREYAAQAPQPRALNEVEAREALMRLSALLDRERAAGRRIVFTNGVFDILHAGHVHLLRQAKQLGDVLVVAVNSDRSARGLKGEHRPINTERDRAALVAALDPVDHVILFDEETPEALIRALRPHLHVKGGDYADEQLPEAGAVREFGGQVVIVPLIGNTSTSSVIDRILALAMPETREVES